MNFFLPAALAAASLLGAQTASAADCKPQQILSTLPLTDAGGGLFNIDVLVNDVKAPFLFDTGGSFPQVSATLADQLKMRRMDSAIEIYGVNGAMSKSYTTADSFQFGTLRAAKFDMPISPLEENIFSPLVFPAYDFELDFAAGKINVISSDHCDGQVIYWPAKAASAVPISTTGYHITVPVTVDGRELTAVIDTGAPDSTMSLDVAKYDFGLVPDSPDMKAEGHINGDEKAVIYSHAFKSMTFDGLAVSNPKIAILTDIVNKNADHTAVTGSHAELHSDAIKLPEVIVGMDILSKLHIYLAFHERRMYVTEATRPPPAPGVPAATVAP